MLFCFVLCCCLIDVLSAIAVVFLCCVDPLVYYITAGILCYFLLFLTVFIICVGYLGCPFFGGGERKAG